jgi:ABC-2 type transport system permease protein
MQAFFTLVRRELGAHFFSWTGYVVIAAVLFLMGYSFHNLLLALNATATDRPATEVFYSTMYFWLILLVAAPVITMRSFALEKYSGTFETLMTTPVSDLQVVMAKFVGAMIFYLLMWLPLIVSLFIIRHFSHEPSLVDAATLSSTFAGILLLGSMYIALGCFASALTRSQIIAAVLSFAGGIALFLLSFISMTFAAKVGWKAQLFSYLGLIEHMQDFARGVIDTRPLVFYFSTTFFLLFLTLRVVESRRWKP